MARQVRDRNVTRHAALLCWLSPLGGCVATIDDCIPDQQAGSRIAFCEGMKFNLKVPPACLTESCGLIIDVHGGGSSARQQEQLTGLAELGGAAGYVVLQPNATIKPAYAFAPNWVPALDDDRVYQYARAVEAAFAIDPNRIHMTGFSQGSMMTWRFACAHSDWLASIAPASGTGYPPGEARNGDVDCDFDGSEVPIRALDILFMHGVSDDYSSFADAEAKAARIAALFELSLLSADSLDDAAQQTHYSRSDGLDFFFIEHQYESAYEVSVPILGIQESLQSHCVPTLKLDDDARHPYHCEPPNAFDWGQRVLDFFIAHPRVSDRAQPTAVSAR